MKQRFFKGVSIIEILVAMTVFIVIAIPAYRSIDVGYRNVSFDNKYLQAIFHAQEGIEAARQVRAASWNNLSSGTYGIQLGAQGWQFISTAQTTSGLLRTIIISDVYRDASGNLSDTPGILEPDAKKIESKVSWEWLPGKSKEINLVSYLTNAN